MRAAFTKDQVVNRSKKVLVAKARSDKLVVVVAFDKMDGNLGATERISSS